MPPVIFSSSPPPVKNSPWDGEEISPDGFGNKNYNRYNNGGVDNSGSGNKNYGSDDGDGNNNNNSNNNNNNNNNNSSSGGSGKSNSSQNQRPASSSSATERTISPSTKSTPTETFFSIAASTSGTSSSFSPASAVPESTSSDKLTSIPPLPSSSNPVPPPVMSTISGPSTNDALGVSTTPKDIHRVLPLGSIVAIILGCLFCITIALVIYVITRPRFGSLGRLWKKSTATIGSFEPKERGYRPREMYMPDEYTRSISRSHLLDNFQFPAPSNERAHSSIAHSSIAHNSIASSSHVVEPGSAPPASPASLENYPDQSYVVPSPSSIPAPRSSSPDARVARASSPNYRSITRILSMLEGYPFEHHERGQASDNALNYPRSVYGTVE